jgi:hypothetical protein
VYGRCPMVCHPRTYSNYLRGDELLVIVTRLTFWWLCRRRNLRSRETTDDGDLAASGIDARNDSDFLFCSTTNPQAEFRHRSVV